jgi:hypothetical protein
MRWSTAIVGCVGGLALAATATALGDGGPVPALQGGHGVSAPGSHVRYVAVGTRAGTLIRRIGRGDGAVRGSRLIHGDIGVPGVGVDGSATGLSADGRRLVLAQITRRYPPRRTRLVVLDARRLRVLERLSLPGFFAVDAVSPAGRWLYLIHYTSQRNLLRYEVRAYDLRAGRLLRRPIVDPRELGEGMRGIALTRATSEGGRWAYTLYMRPGAAPFVHALDTQRRVAACIDLPGLTIVDPTTLHLSLARGGDILRVVTVAGPQAVIDTRTFAVTRPSLPSAPGAPAKHPRPSGRRSSDGPGGPPPWLTAAIALAFVAGLGGVARVRRRRVASP